MNLKGKIALVTGAGGGIGSFLARRLKKEGCRLILVERELSLLEHLADLFDGPETTKFACDFTKKKEIGKLLEEIKRKNDRIDFLYHVAGIGAYKKIEELSFSEWETSLAINLNAPFFLTRGLLPLLTRGEKSLVFIFGSGLGKTASAGRVAYCASKFGLRGFSLSLAKEFRGKNIDFVLLTLGSVMTNFGTGGIEKRRELERKGKKYLQPQEVVEKVIEITRADHRQAEYVLYPEGYEKK